MKEADPTAVIAEDEPLLGMNLQAELARLWPELDVVANVRHGAAAHERSLALRPDLVFLDIRMPGMNGIEVAQAVTEDWEEGTPLPLMVFVTAYDEYALQAFDLAAADYVLKPVSSDRLAKTCGRLRAAVASRRASSANPRATEAALAQLRSLLEAPGVGAPGVVAPGVVAPGVGAPGVTGAATGYAPPLNIIQASVGAAVHLVPVTDVLYFEAADKYVNVVTATREYLIRMSLRQLVPQLDAQRFWQIHRGMVVRVDAIASALRDDFGKVEITLHDHPRKLIASRLYAYLFKAM